MSLKRERSANGDAPHAVKTSRSLSNSNARCLAACLRCKQRKLKCDGAIPKCGPCAKADAECLAKDQMSSRPVPRGYLEVLENKAELLERRNQQLEEMLRDYAAGKKAKVGSPYALPSPGPTESADPENGKSIKETGMPRFYLGGSSSNLYINGVRESAMSFLGVEIDVDDMNPADMDYPFASVLGIRRPSVPELPPYEEALTMVHEYFRGVHKFMPTLHRPTIMCVLDKLYNDPSYTPRAAVMTIIYGIFANVSIYRDTYFEDLKLRAHQVYFQRLSPYLHEVFFREIYRSEIEVLQAMNVILIYLRVVKKPAAGWLPVEVATSLAVDMGLHRNPHKWMTVLPNPLEMEMRKRVFWCTIALSRSISNNLGRPSALREIDCDVGLPALIDDEYIDEHRYQSQPADKPCEFTPGVEVFKLARITGHINELLYAPNRPDRKSYVTVVEQLENALSSWLEEVPAHLRYDPAHPENIAASMMMQAYHECRILIRHPSLDLSPSPPFAEASLEICVKSSYEMIDLIERNRAQGYLDITWPSIQKLMLATLTILYGLWQRREKAEPKDFRQIKQQMNRCIQIMSDLGKRLVSARRLGQTIRVLVDATFRSMNPRQNTAVPLTPSQIPPQSSLMQQQQQQQQQPQQPQPQPPQQQPQYPAQFLPQSPSTPYRNPSGVPANIANLYPSSNDSGVWWNVNWNEYMRSVAPDLGNLAGLGDWVYGDGADGYFGFPGISPESSNNSWSYTVT